ncbi:Threonine/homoserine exporter RhtA [Roseivivax sp. THAF40]|uniref:DMT family transporter n=1 Tax=unclassified Roseivivax TaxID=2639302 RepID=UPI0012A8FD8A|nr:MULTISPECIES: DMT family transporter [unclassified Roseivivax]QFS84090.1 Threonine/homoserine exporter RhtA [Roseivivax sp. THAF197b]QFT47917.1 Threonine/homoserine exporter RhtA [Roseivivax sp. THAF40]
MDNSARILGLVAVIAAAMLWGTTGTVQTLLPPERAPLAVGALRLAVGALSLVALALAQPACRRAIGSLPLGGIAFAGAAIGLYNLLFFWGVTEAGVGIGTAITIGSAPFWATAYEVLALRRLPTPLRAAGLVLSVAGVALLATAGTTGAASALGIALTLGAGACYATYSLATSRVGQRAPSTAIAAATFTIAALFALPVLFILPLGWLAAPGALAAIGFLGIAATGLSYALYTWGLTRVAASTAVTLALAEPVTAWLLATFLVGEPVSTQSIAGALLVLAGLAIVTLSGTRRAD